MKHKSITLIMIWSFSIATCLVAAGAAASGLVVYPAKGQSDTKMSKDKAECSQWATKETGVDPVALANESTTQAGSSTQSGQRVRGGARGAAGGAAIGAIAGDAGKGAAIGATTGGMRGGMKQREERREGKEAEQQAQSQKQQKLATYDKAYSACLEGRGYTVK